MAIPENAFQMEHLTKKNMHTIELLHVYLILMCNNAGGSGYVVFCHNDLQSNLLLGLNFAKIPSL